MFRFILPICLTMVTLVSANAQSIDPDFFANKEVQRLKPLAFALQPESRAFLLANQSGLTADSTTLINLIEQDKTLSDQIKTFPALDWSAKEEVLKKVFALEVQAFNIKGPGLIIDSERIKGREAFFEFDVAHPNTGTVFLNPEQLQKNKNPFAPLLLLIHETRHSAQFQRAFDPASEENAVNLGFKAAFTAQQELSDKIRSYSDFLTLNNEYEAFYFGNFIVENLTGGQVNTLGMGTYASQFDNDNHPKIDLIHLFEKFDNGEIQDSVLDEFNRLEKAEYDLL
jgi:hypothetical protein